MNGSDMLRSFIVLNMVILGWNYIFRQSSDSGGLIFFFGGGDHWDG